MPSEYELTPKEKFMGFMILVEDFRKDVLTAVETEDKDKRIAQLEKIINEDNGIGLDRGSITEMATDWHCGDNEEAQKLMDSLRTVIDTSKMVYDPGAGNW